MQRKETEFRHLGDGNTRKNNSDETKKYVGLPNTYGEPANTDVGSTNAYGAATVTGGGSTKACVWLPNEDVDDTVAGGGFTT